MSFALGVVIILYIVVLLCRYSWYLGYKKGLENET